MLGNKGDSRVIISSYPFPSNTATANRLRFLCQAIGGTDIIAVQGDDRSMALQGGLEVHAIALSKSKNIFIRALKELDYLRRVLYSLDMSEAFVLISIPSPFLVFLGYFLRSHAFGIDVRDCSWEYLLGGGPLHRLAARMFLFLSYVPFRKAKFVTCTNEEERASITKHFGREASVVPNGIELRKYERLRRVESEVPKIHQSKSILYVGNLGRAQRLETLIGAAALRREYQFLLVGDGVEKDRLIGLSREKNLDNVVFLPSRSWESLLELYSTTDVLYAQITKEYSSAIPTKVFEYLAVGKRTVLGLPEGIAKRTFSQFQSVLVHEPGNVLDCAQRLQESVVSGRSASTADQELLKKYIRENYTSRIRDLFEAD